MDRNLIRRTLQATLLTERDKKFVSVVVGPRQVGKTTLFHQLIEVLTTPGVPANKIVFLNFDDLGLRSVISANPSDLIKEIETRLGLPLTSLKERFYLFLDEAQKIPQIFEVVKLLFDSHGDRVKIYLSGSSSLELQRKASETLAGRIRYHYLFPITLKELLFHYNLWTDSDSPLQLLLKNQLTEEVLNQLQAAFWEKRNSIETIRQQVLLSGSLPAVLTEDSEEEKWFILRDYVATYLEKEIRAIEGVHNIDLFHRFYRALLLQHGQILNVSNLAGDLGMSRNTALSYLNILEQTFLLYRISSYARKPKVRLMKAPKTYFFDAGIVNHGMRLTSWEAIRSANRQGFLEEGLFVSQVLSLAKEMSVPPEIYYLRDYQGHEIDFLIEGESLIGVEITSEDSLRKKRFINIDRFNRDFPLEKIFVVGNFPRVDWETVNGKRITLLPLWLAW
ncbi:MAG: ATP-binding protein [Candidatus Omnitrophota bacterium]